MGSFFETDTPLVCTLKSAYEGATWDFLGNELKKKKKIRVATTQFFFLEIKIFSQFAKLKTNSDCLTPTLFFSIARISGLVVTASFFREPK